MRRPAAITQNNVLIDDGGSFAVASAYRNIAVSTRSIANSVRQMEAQAGVEDAQKALATGEGREGRLLDVLTVRDESYRAALSVLGVARAEEDSEAEFAQLQAENPNNPEGFASAAEAYIESYVAEAPLEAAGTIEASMRREARRIQSGLQVDRIEKDQREAVSALDARIERKTEQLKALAEDGAVDSQQYAVLAAEVNDLLSIKVDSPLTDYSDEERINDERALASDLRSAFFRPQLAARYDELGYADALEMADDLSEAAGETPAERAALRQTLRQEVNLLRQNEAAAIAEDNERTARAKREAANAKDDVGRMVIEMIADPEVSQQEALAVLRQNAGLFSTSEYTTLFDRATSEESAGVSELHFLELERAVRAGTVSLDDIVDADLNLSAGQRSALSSALTASQKATAQTMNTLFDAAFVNSPLDFNNAVASAKARAEVAADEYLTQNPEITPEQARAKALEIINDQAKIYAVQSEIPSLTGVGPGLFSIEAVAKAKSDLTDANIAGQVTDKQFEEHLEKLNELELMLNAGK